MLDKADANRQWSNIYASNVKLNTFFFFNFYASTDGEIFIKYRLYGFDFMCIHKICVAKIR